MHLFQAWLVQQKTLKYLDHNMLIMIIWNFTDISTSLNLNLTYLYPTLSCCQIYEVIIGP